MGGGDVQNLTQRQKDILRLLLNGFDAKSAARELGISVHTVNEHLREARRQLGVSSSREAARLLRQAEGAPPNDVGPKPLGVVDRARRQLWIGRSSRARRLAYAGVSLVILVAIMGIALSIAHQGPLSNPTNALTKAEPARPGVQPDPYRYRKIATGAFDRLKVTGPFKVGVIVGPEPARVELVGPPALLADTIATVEGTTLVIRFREGATWSWNPGSGVNAVVFAPRLTAVRLEGSGDVEINGLRGDMVPGFSAATDGSGSIVIRQLDVPHVDLATSGPGGITVEGRARDGTYLVGGPGSIDAKRLRVARATIAVSGAGSAYADVSKTANISVTGAGGVDLVGGATCIEQPAHSPHVQCR
jgi:DNA-binding CsgD family transcriptional regulator